jgi:signal transduction histidine kinase
MVLMLFDSSDIGLTKELFDSQMRESVSCNEVARESIADTKEHFPQLDILFETSIPDTLHIHTNRLYLMRSLREILYNAAKYSDGKHVAMKITETEHTIRFTIEDKGIGIPESYHDSMYQFFTKVNDLSEGLGLGLPLSQRHVSNLGGTLTLDSSYQEGCRFIVEIPKV